MDFLHESELFLLTNERNLSNSRIEVRSDEGARLHEHDQQSKPAHGSGTRGCHRCVQVLQSFLNWTFFWPSANNSNQELLERQCLIFSLQELWDRSEGSDNSPKGWFKKMLLFIEIFSLILFFFKTPQEDYLQDLHKAMKMLGLNPTEQEVSTKDELHRRRKIKCKIY